MQPTQIQIRQEITVQGVVQGVGFRPFVYRLANQLGVRGTVSNTSSGVTIDAQGAPPIIDAFKQALKSEAPPAARIESIDSQAKPTDLEWAKGFHILRSQRLASERTLVGSDLATCEDCRSELFDPSDRRYRYPFINCTNCGPRFTIIQDIPYDRALTTMADFEMCPACQSEYNNPLDRRFHAQPNACPDCGPQVWIEFAGHPVKLDDGQDPFEMLGDALSNGLTVAVKGLGGFHLACDATHNAAIAALRHRKGRVDKPFALMAADLDTIKQFAHVSKAEEALLLGPERPIVLLQKREKGTLSDLVAPGNRSIGVMLPYTPIHYLLLEQIPILVMTSANLSGEPIVCRNDEARSRLSNLADLFLMHNREIDNRCDDAVIRSYPHSIMQTKAEAARSVLPIRRARGYAPFPVRLHGNAPQVLAVGGELKATFCITQESYAYMGPHVGDMVNIETLSAFEESVDTFLNLFRLEPEIIACDLHPGYLSTEWAKARRKERRMVQVQHHHAHIAALMGEQQLSDNDPIIGFAFDGTGYGPDGAIWGGEVLIANYSRYQRRFHLDYVPLAGGDVSVKRPYRMALAHLRSAGLAWDAALPPVAACPADERNLYLQQLEKGINSVPTSSMGRLFDAVASLIGLCHTINYEGQAAIELEAIADRNETGAYPFEIGRETFSATPLFQKIVADLSVGVSPAVISARFHNGLANLVCEIACHIRLQTGIRHVGLSGGVFQNMRLLECLIPKLVSEGFDPLLHRFVPPNDGGLALGQALIAAYQQA